MRTFYLWINSFKHSATQNTIIDPENNFFNSVVNNTCNITYKKDSVPFHLYFNCGSLGSKFDDLKNYISNITFQFDVIALSETWLKPYMNIAVNQLND